MNCGGAVKVFKRRSEEGPATHIEHKLKNDSEYCSAGMYFLKATDGRLARLSRISCSLTRLYPTCRIRSGRLVSI